MKWQKGGRRKVGVGVGVEGDSEDVGGDGGGDEEPSKLTEEKVGTSSFSTVITLRLQESAGGEGSSWKGGRGEGLPVEHWLLRQPEQPGVQLHAGCGEPLLVDRGDDGDAQLARMLKKTRWKALE